MSNLEMTTSRVEAFSDGVMAIIITIMAFEVKRPKGADLEDLTGILPTLLVFVLSFVFIGIYWNNHHHLLGSAKKITPTIMWANLHLLLWLCLIPIVTAWVGAYYTESLPAAGYASVCLLAAVAYWLLTRAIIKADKPGSGIERAIGGDMKGNLSLAGYAAAIALAFVSPYITYGLCVAVDLLWIIPDRRLAPAE